LNAVASDELRFRGSCDERQVAGDGLLRGVSACRRSTQRSKGAAIEKCSDRKVQRSKSAAIEKCSDRKVQATAVSSITTYVLQNDMRFSEGLVSVVPTD
jgi:hypothetical protein